MGAQYAKGLGVRIGEICKPLYTRQAQPPRTGVSTRDFYRSRQRVCVLFAYFHQANVYLVIT